MVGSRNASAAGMTIAKRLAHDLGEAGFVVVSGLARGIDAAAHRGSLARGTVAVLAGGHDRPYPPEHVDLLAAIVEHGAAVSEMPLGWTPRGRDFPRRNRLIAGLVFGVVVVEAARRPARSSPRDARSITAAKSSRYPARRSTRGRRART